MQVMASKFRSERAKIWWHFRLEIATGPPIPALVLALGCPDCILYVHRSDDSKFGHGSAGASRRGRSNFKGRSRNKVKPPKNLSCSSAVS